MSMEQSTHAFILTSPILPGRTEAWRRFCQELTGTRSQEYMAWRRRLGVVCEHLWLLRLDRAEIAVLYIEVSQPQKALLGLLNSSQPFDLWYRRRLRELHGLDVTLLDSDQATETIYHWRDPGRQAE